MQTSRTEQKHWLEEIAAGAGLTDLRLDANPGPAALRAAWSAIADHTGVSEQELAEQVAKRFNLEVADLTEAEPHAIKLLPESSARAHGLLPMHASDLVIVTATTDPTSAHAEQDLQFLSGRRPLYKIAPPGALLNAIDAAYSKGRVMDFVLQNLAAEASHSEVEILPNSEDQDNNDGGAEAATGTLPVTSLVKRFLLQAASVGAEEVVMEGGTEGGLVRFRLGGEPQHYMRLPHTAHVRVVRRLKELAELDTKETQQVQEGQFAALISGHRYVMRVRIEPGKAVEHVRLRLSDPSVRRTFSELGLPVSELDSLRALLDGPQGVILIAGSPDRARDTLLTAFGRALALKGPTTIVDSALTAQFDDIEQVQAAPDAGFRFSEAIAQALEADPACVIVSQLDTSEAARLAMAAADPLWVVAAVTGPDPASAVQTLRELSIPDRLLGLKIRGVISYRSLRRLCDHCRRPVEANESLPIRERVLADAFGVEPTGVAVGCARCHETGYAGDLVVTHTVPVSLSGSEAIASGARGTDLRNALSTDSTLEMSALQQVRTGNTSLHEVERTLPPALYSYARDRARPRILIVDDAEDVRLQVRSILESAGLEVIEARDGAAALVQIAKHSGLSLVLLDLNMPRMGGTEVLAQLRASLRTATLPVVVLTGADDEKLEIQLLEAGADDYLVKPVDPRRLVVRVQAVLRRAGSASIPV